MHFHLFLHVVIIDMKVIPQRIFKGITFLVFRFTSASPVPSSHCPASSSLCLFPLEPYLPWQFSDHKNLALGFAVGGDGTGNRSDLCSKSAEIFAHKKDLINLEPRNMTVTLSFQSRCQVWDQAHPHREFHPQIFILQTFLILMGKPRYSIYWLPNSVASTNPKIKSCRYTSSTSTKLAKKFQFVIMLGPWKPSLKKKNLWPDPPIWFYRYN